MRIILHIIILLELFSFDVLSNTLEYKLIMLGYTQQEVNEILSGKKTINDIENEQKKIMLGFPNEKKAFIETNVVTGKSDVKSETNGNNELSKAIIPIPLQSDPISSNIDFFITQPYRNPITNNDIKFDLFLDENEQQILISSAEQFMGFIEDASRRNNIKKSLILAIIKVESNFDHKAVSPKGALGLMQLMPDTAKKFGVQNVFDPKQNIEAGTRYLLTCLQTLNDLKLAIAAYNAGLTKVLKNKEIPEFKETIEFVRNVFKYERMYDKAIRGL